MTDADDHPSAEPPGGTGSRDEMVSPVMVEILRGGAVESRHRGAAAVVDAAGRLIACWGDTERPVFPRSAVKPLQGLRLVESGAADACAAPQAEIALACGSHTGSARHVATAREWLGRLGLAETDLECGAHPPRDATESHRLVLAGEGPGPLHNNCSGKHLGFLALVRHIGAPTKGYVSFTHPVQQSVLGVLEVMTGTELAGAPRGIDGCGVPTIAVPLTHLALALARLGAPDSLSDGRARACRRITAAMVAEPEMVVGPDRFTTEMIRATRGRVLAKTGAEGVHVAVLPEWGVGVAIKIEDGAARAAEVAMAALLVHLGILDDRAKDALAEFFTPAEVNWAGRVTGEIRPAPG